MGAGSGFKTFNTGDVLTAADVNGYLMQGIWVFANAAARDAAVTSPQQGNTCYLKDTNIIQSYSGTAWVTKSGSASPLTTKGDLYTYSTSDTRLGVGTDGQVLSASSAAATGLAWTTLTSGSLTQIATVTHNNTTGTWNVTGIPSTYKNLLIVGQGLSGSDSSARDVWLKLNNDTTATYTYNGVKNQSSTVSYDGNVASSNTLQLAPAGMPPTAATATQYAQFLVNIPLYSGSQYKSMTVASTTGINASGTSAPCGFNGGGTWASTSAINQITIFLTATNFKTGTFTLYGVN